MPSSHLVGVVVKVEVGHSGLVKVEAGDWVKMQFSFLLFRSASSSIDPVGKKNK